MGIPMFLFWKKVTEVSEDQFLDLWTLDRPPKKLPNGRMGAFLPRLEGCVSRNLFPKADRILKLMKDRGYRIFAGYLEDGLPGKCLVNIT